MLSPGPIRPISIALDPVQGTQSAVFRPGHTLQGVIQGAPGHLTLQVANARVPLDPAIQLLPGQNVLVEVRAAGDTLQLRIANRPDGPQPSAAMPNKLASVLTAVLENAGMLDRASVAAQLMPPKLPPTAETVRALMTLFTQRSPLGNDLERMVALARQAAAAGALPRETADELEALAGRLVARDAGALRQTLEQWTASTGQSTEARLAQALASGNLDDALQRLRLDLRSLLSRLKGDDAFARFLRDTGQLREFGRRVDQALERLGSHDAQNLRGIDQPYFFLEIPFAPDAPIRHAQVHFLGEQAGQGRRFDKTNVMVALDLNTTGLGDLWILLRITQGRCHCTILAAQDTARVAFETAAPELREALAGAGYPEAVVQTQPWHGDRLTETAAFVRRLSGLDVEA